MKPAPVDRAATAAVAAALNGEDVRLSAADVDTAIAESVAPLLAASAAAQSLDPASHARLLAHVHGAAAQDAALDEELRRILPRLAAGGHAPLVVKGAHLAHALYPSPHLRTRGDSDLLIAPAQRRAVAAALTDAGYAPAALTSGSVILGQFLYRRPLGPAIVHHVDVHWRAAAPLVFDEAFDSAALAARAVAIPALGPGARGPALEDALALACVHVVAHHWPDGSLRWWYDIRLLAERLGEDGRDRLAGAASAGRYVAVTIAALERTRTVFPSTALDAALDVLRRMPASREPSAALTRLRRPPLHDFLLDLRVAGWRRGATLVREHLLPPPSYMRMAFAGRPLPIAYAERLVRAVTKRL
jgi:hypothetical protein